VDGEPWTPGVRRPGSPHKLLHMRRQEDGNCDVRALPQQGAVVRLLAERCCAPATESAGSVQVRRTSRQQTPARPTDMAPAGLYRAGVADDPSKLIDALDETKT
jgi:hypothetical protein